MLYEHTITQLQALRLEGMALGLQEQFTSRRSDDLSFEERLGLLVDRETTYRENKKQARLLKSAKLKVSTACLEDVDYRPGRGLDKKQVASFASCD